LIASAVSTFRSPASSCFKNSVALDQLTTTPPIGLAKKKMRFQQPWGLFTATEVSNDVWSIIV